MGRGAAGEEALAKYNAYLDIVCSFITWLLARDYDVRIIIGDLTYDDEVRHDVRKRLRQTGTVLDSHKYIDEPATSFEDLLEQLRLVDFLVATRFHSVLLALLTGRPAVSISYDAKNDVLMRDMGLGEYCQSLSRLNFDRLVEQFIDLEKNASQLIPTMQLKAAEFRSKLDEQYRIVLGGDRQSI
jgi:polysaccharide pyruvyl transferase WcaK-like protein